ncbi:MAG TPA: hypothetical protein VGJ45_03955 [Pseudonocardiaceae bacterium]|jgi:hypothetical protein
MTSTLLAQSDNTTAAPELDLPFAISMLDGGLGAVPGLAGKAAAPRADVFCWCGCMVCFVPTTPSSVDDSED